MARFDKDPLGAAAQARQHFIADCTGPFCQIVDADMGTEYLDPTAADGKVFRNIGDVEGNKVHGNAAQYGHLVFSDISDQTTLRAAGSQVAENAVCIAKRDRRDTGAAFEPLCGSVTNCFPCVGLANLCDAAVKLNNRGQGWPTFDRAASIKGKSGSDEIEVIWLSQKNTAGISQ